MFFKKKNPNILRLTNSKKRMQKSFNKLLVNSLVTLITFTYFTYLSKADTFVYSGGCFWCTEADTEKLDGVSDVISGFTAGTTKDHIYLGSGEITEKLRS